MMIKSETRKKKLERMYFTLVTSWLRGGKVTNLKREDEI